MSGEGFIFNDSPDGQRAFDSRLPTQVVYIRGTAEIAGPASGVYAATLFVPYGKPFAKIPYVRSAARIINVTGNFSIYKDIYPSMLSWSQNNATGAQFFSGNYTAAQITGLYLGNAWPNGVRLRSAYAIFENPVQ